MDDGPDDKPKDFSVDWSLILPEERERYRRWYNRRYRDPAARLRQLRPMFTGGPGTAFRGEERKAAARLSEEFVGTLFTYAMSEKYEGRWLYSHGETDTREGDGIRWVDDGIRLNLAPVQVKEIRDPLTSSRTLSDELARIAQKYPRSPELIVAVALRANGKYPFRDAVFPKMEVDSLYCLISMDDQLSRWILAGNLLLERGDIYFEFESPK